MEKNILCSYTMTDDTGFAPNPYHGILTLATCKPQIRRSERVKEGVWIAGWAGKALQKNGERELIYLAKVCEKIPLEEYWSKYEEKRPLLIADSYKEGDKADKGKNKRIQEQAKNDPKIKGDNIYNANLDWQPNNYHPQEVRSHDIGGKNVIISKEFYYFGGEEGKHLYIPECYNIKLPMRYFVYTEDSIEDPVVTNFIEYVRKNSNNATKK